MSKRVRIGVRVSTRKQEELTSLASQERECRRWADERGYTVESISKEIYTGTELFDRPQLSKDRQDFTRGLFDVYLYYSTDRLTRDPIHLAIVALECQRNGIELAFVTDPFEDNVEGELIRYIKGFAGKLEHARIRERNVRGKYQLAVSGRLHRSGADLYGYRRDKEINRRIIYEPEAEIVRRIFQMTIDGHGMRMVARLLQAEGVPPPSAGKINLGREAIWQRTTISRILRHEAYKGQTVAWKWKTNYVNGRMKGMKARDTTEWVHLPDDITPAIVSPETWERANQMIVERRCIGEYKNLPHLLRGMVFCSACGSRMYGNEKKGWRHFRCSSRLRVRCAGKAINSNVIEKDVWAKAKLIIANPDRLRAEYERGRKSETNTSRRAVEKLQGDLTKIERGHKRLMKMFLETEDDIWAAKLEKQLQEQETQRQKVLSNLRIIEQNDARTIASEQTYVSFAECCAQIEEQVDEMEFDDRRRLLVWLSTTVIGSGKTYTISFTLPTVDFIMG